MAGKTFGFSSSTFTSKTAATLQANANTVVSTPLETPASPPGGPYLTETGNFWSSNEIYGHNGQDQIIGGYYDDWLYGLGGNDTVWGLNGDDHIDGGAGNDELFGGDGDDELIGAEGFDTLTGGDGDDSLHAFANEDELHGGKGEDELYFGHTSQKNAGYHQGYGGEGNDSFTIHLPGRASAHGGDGDDYFIMDGEGSMFGEAGNDVLISDHGDDDYDRKQHIMSGGEDADHFKVRVWQFSNKDVYVTDFSAAEGDAFTLSGSGGKTYDSNKDGKLSAADANVSVAHGNLTVAADDWTVNIFNTTEVELTAWY